MLGWSLTGKASAEHGSALQFRPLPFAQRRGGLGRGSFCPCRAEPCSAGALPGKPLPSMARHYIVIARLSSRFAPSLARSAGEGWGGVLFAASSKPKATPTPTPTPTPSQPPPWLRQRGGANPNHSTSFGSAFQYPVARIHSFGTCRCPSTNLRIIRARLDSVAIQ